MSKVHEGYEKYDDRVMDQKCADYLKYCGIEVEDGEMINCPYRPTSDSCSFVVKGPLYYDHARGSGGNVWQLAMKMNNRDKHSALASLHSAAGVPFIPDPEKEKILSNRETAQTALKRVYDAFKIDPATTPAHVIEYLNGRKVGDRTRHYFSYIPKDKLRTVLMSHEIEMTGLGSREELIIFWYLIGGEPVYYCTRDITTKMFKKASRENGLLSHPIWNRDSLYNDAHVVWGEGMFDCISLLELGYGVAGEITCNLINEHKPDLLKALHWRAKHHPDWTFTICLDNDELAPDGKRHGNEAAEKLALWLLNNGVDIKWVKHDPADKKIDINQLHQSGLDVAVKTMIGNAKFVSEIVAVDGSLCLKNFTRMLTHQDYRGAARTLALMEKQDENATLRSIIEKTHKIPWDWREVYAEAIKEIFPYCGDIYVVFDKEHFGAGQRHYEVFKSTDVIRNLRKFQINPEQIIALSDLNLEYRRPTWRVSKGEMEGTKSGASKDEYNLFAPSPLLLQTPRTGAVLPEMWSKVLDNLAGKDEKEWLLNHMAVYVQGLEKPRTIPVFVGKQGTGKTALIKLLGDGIGGFIAVDNALIESEFNSYLMTPVVLLDELANSQKDSNQLKNRLKQLINETQSINAKHRQVISVELNNYIVIASNEQTSHVPLVIEDGDRRYCVISGGQDRNLAHEAWFDYQVFEKQLPGFMLHLLSRPIDTKAAEKPLLTEKKQQITDASQDYKTACVRAFLEETQSNAVMKQTLMLTDLCNQINDKYNPQFHYIPRFIKPILEGLGYKIKLVHKQNAIEIEPENDADKAGGDEAAYSPSKSPEPPVAAKSEVGFEDWDAREDEKTSTNGLEDPFDD